MSLRAKHCNSVQLPVAVYFSIPYTVLFVLAFPSLDAHRGITAGPDRWCWLV